MEPEEKAVGLLLEKGLQITTAESCTGGMIASALINVPGISSLYKEGYITYSNEAKQKLLSVKKETLMRFGAVSRQTAEEMARGAAAGAGAEVSLSATGIAGPGGGTQEKPVGLVYIGCFVKGRVRVKEERFTGDRKAIRQKTTKSAIEFLLECLENSV